MTYHSTQLPIQRSSKPWVVFRSYFLTIKI